MGRLGGHQKVQHRGQLFGGGAGGGGGEAQSFVQKSCHVIRQSPNLRRPQNPLFRTTILGSIEGGGGFLTSSSPREADTTAPMQGSGCVDRNTHSDNAHVGTPLLSGQERRVRGWFCEWEWDGACALTIPDPPLAHDRAGLRPPPKTVPHRGAAPLRITHNVPRCSRRPTAPRQSTPATRPSRTPIRRGPGTKSHATDTAVGGGGC